MRSVNRTFLCATVLLIMGKHAIYAAEKVTVRLDPSKIIGPVDEKIYGHFLEHIYHSVNGGLWGEKVWNRSFEEFPDGREGRWTVKDDELEQSLRIPNVRLLFGDVEWKDYEFTLEARKNAGAEGFLIICRSGDDEEFYWANLGGWGNRRHAFEKGRRGSRWTEIGEGVRGRIETGRWYKIRVRCEGPSIQVWLDDGRVLDLTDAEDPHPTGRVGLGSWDTGVSYRNVKVTSLDGKTLFEGIPGVTRGDVIARHWRPYGEGTFQITNENPQNSEYAQEIVSNGGEAGVEQENFSLRGGESHPSYVFIRGEAPDGVVIRVRDGDSVVFEETLPAPDPTWVGFMFDLVTKET